MYQALISTLTPPLANPEYANHARVTEMNDTAKKNNDIKLALKYFLCLSSISTPFLHNCNLY
jgi:hypothetical protein